MNPCFFYSHVFKEDPHLRYGPGLYYRDDGRPTYSQAGDLLAIFIAQELYEASEPSDWKDIQSFQNLVVSKLLPASQEIKDATVAISQLLIDALEHGRPIELENVFEALDQSYPDGFTANYHDDQGRPANMTNSGDTLAKWLVAQAAEVYGEAPAQASYGWKIGALTTLTARYTAGLNRILTICNLLITL